MKQRGRKSKDNSSVVVIHEQIAQSIDPPSDLSEEEQAIWHETLEGQPPSFFDTPATQALLADYCRHKATGAALTKTINEQFPDLSVLATDVAAGRRFAQITRVRDRETRAAANIATKLRLTNQARYSTSQADRRSTNVAKETPPWE